MAGCSLLHAAAFMLVAAFSHGAHGLAADYVDLCTYNVGLCGINSYSGFVPILGQGALYYWYFELLESAPTAPLTLWLQGGPGTPSMAGVLFELGPVAVSEIGRLHRRDVGQTWTSRMPVVFVDSPVGTGWSYADDDDGFARDEHDVAYALREFLIGFHRLHPEVPKRLVLAGESFGGHYVPALAAHLLKHPTVFRLEAISIGNGLTDPAEQVLTKPQEAFHLGLIDEVQLEQVQELAQQAHDLAKAGDYGNATLVRNMMEGLVYNFSNVNLMDVRTTDGYAWQDERMATFFGQNATKDMLHVPRNRTFGTDPKVIEYLLGDKMMSQKDHVENVLRANVKVLLYQGQFDWRDGVVGNEAWIRKLRWPGNHGYRTANRTIWRRASDGQVAGYWRYYGNLHQVTVLGAGHMAPMNQPLSVMDMMARFLALPAVEVADEGLPEAPEIIREEFHMLTE